MDRQFGGAPGAELEPLTAGRSVDHLAINRNRQLRETIRAAWLRAKRNRSVNTAAAYERDITTFFGWCDQNDIDALSVFAPDVEGYVEWLRTSGNSGRYKSKLGRSDSTVNRMVTVVSSYFAYAVKHSNGVIPTNPVDLIDRLPVSADSVTLGLSREEVDKLREVARGRGLREYALIQLLLGTGLRVSEVCNADTGDMTTDSGRDVLLVTRKGGKRARVPIPPAAARALKRYLIGRRGPLFLLDNGHRMTRRMVDWHLSQMAKASGIDKRISPHSLRHTAATLALDAGAPLRDVQVQLGHARPDTTARYDRARRDLNNAAATALADIVEDQ